MPKGLIGLPGQLRGLKRWFRPAPPPQEVEPAAELSKMK